MAHPILLELPPRDPRAELRSRLEDAPAEHAEALLAAYEVLQGLQDRGLLEIMRGALGSSDKVLEIAVDAAKAPESIRSIRNLLLLVNMLGSIEPEVLVAFTRAVPQALSSMARHPEPPGLWKLTMSFLWDRNIRRCLSALDVLLKTVGGSLAQSDRHLQTSATDSGATHADRAMGR
jgi:uncharacterized protein YjgD (DUF1641 family)